MKSPVAALLLLCSALAAACARQSAPAENRPSVLLVTLTAVRADHLTTYGAHLTPTPVFDRLASQGTLFLRAYASAPDTLPSAATLLTGLYPPSTGVRNNGGTALPDEITTLAERFRDAGYATAAFTSAPGTEAAWGLDQGFQLYRDRQDRAEAVVDDALAAMSQVSGPVFAWVNLSDAEQPLDPPLSYKGRGPRKAYDATITSQDTALGRLVEAWDSAHPDAVLVVTAEHGEALGESGELRHGALLNDATLRVPLLLRGAGTEAERIPARTRSENVVGLVDVVPTLLDLADLRPHAGLQGEDLLADGSGEIYSEAMSGWSSLGLSPLYALTNATGRYTEGTWGGWYPATGDFVWTEADPTRETGDLSKHLHEVMDTLPLRAGTPAVVDSEDLARLAAVGYVGHTPDAPPGSTDPRNATELLSLVREIRQSSEAELFWPAEHRLSELEASAPDAWGAELLRAQVYLDQGRLNDAVPVLADMAFQDPQPTEELFVADVLSHAGRDDEALAWYDAVLAIEPDQPLALAGRVRVDLALGDVDDAEVRLALVDLHQPDLALAHAELLLAQGRPEEAMREAGAVLRAHPESAAALATTAQAAWDLGDADEGLDLFRQAVAQDRFNLPLRARLARCELELGQPEDAARLLAPAASLDPDGAINGLYNAAREAAAVKEDRAG